jgi:hypothetical protein
VEEAVDGVEREFGCKGVSEFRRAVAGDGRANGNFAVGKGDDVGRAGYAEEIAVELGHGAEA